MDAWQFNPLACSRMTGWWSVMNKCSKSLGVEHWPFEDIHDSIRFLWKVKAETSLNRAEDPKNCRFFGSYSKSLEKMKKKVSRSGSSVRCFLNQVGMQTHEIHHDLSGQDSWERWERQQQGPGFVGRAHQYPIVNIVHATIKCHEERSETV